MSNQWPGKWFVGEAQLDQGEWGFDGSVWSEPDPSLPPEDQEPDSVAEHIRDIRDARLIAAAPELLAACKLAAETWMLPEPGDPVEKYSAHSEILAAITKAEGQP